METEFVNSVECAEKILFVRIIPRQLCDVREKIEYTEAITVVPLFEGEGFSGQIEDVTKGRHAGKINRASPVAGRRG